MNPLNMSEEQHKNFLNAVQTNVLISHATVVDLGEYIPNAMETFCKCRLKLEERKYIQSLFRRMVVANTFSTN